MELLFRPLRFTGFTGPLEHDLDTTWYTDRGGAVTRARKLQQTYTQVKVVQRADKNWQVDFDRKLPTSTKYPFNDSFTYSTEAGAEKRAKILRAYGYVVAP